MNLRAALTQCPLIAILRGITPDRSVEVAHTLVRAGFRIIEVPLNSPDPFESISRIIAAVGDQAMIGAGTVLTPSECLRLAEIGARVALSPNMNPLIIKTAKSHGLISLPGVATPTEAFAALNAGADGLKLFPAETLGAAAVKAWRAILPDDTLLIPVGGIKSSSVTDYVDAGAHGLGIGSALFSPAKSLEDLGSAANRFFEMGSKLHQSSS